MWLRVEFALALFAGIAAAQSWTHYGGDAAGTRYSALRQITPANVKQLKVAWTYHTHALETKTDLNEKAAFEATPILYEGTLYLSTPFDQVIALDPASGKERWKYDPMIDRALSYSEVTSRGVAASGGRIFIGTIDARLIALDARTGKPCADFGKAGAVDLTREVKLRDRGDYQVTSPPAIFDDLVIVGSSIGDNRAVEVERGIVRAFDARTGALRWTWNPSPWTAGNAWSAMSVDAQRGLVYVPTGSAAPDFYGGLRPGDDKWADSVVALDARTGKLVWGFQVVHHDLWDYDVASQPSLFDLNGAPAVAITTKMGQLFVLNRTTGKPIIPVEERPVPKSDVPGEEAWPTQPFSAADPMAPRELTVTDPACRAKIAAFRTGPMFTPPSIQGSVLFPGNIGGVNWGSAAVDPNRAVLVANTNRAATLVRLIPRDEYVSATTAARDNRISGEFGRQTGAPYAMYREVFLFTADHHPCNAPPWGAVTAMDLKTGKKLWDAGLPSPTLGGPMITAGGLVFTAATMDTYLRAFDIANGKEVWKTELPASAQATPMTYSVGGKQYVVICAGGHGKLGTKMGDAVVAFALDSASR